MSGNPQDITPTTNGASTDVAAWGRFFGGESPALFVSQGVGSIYRAAIGAYDVTPDPAITTPFMVLPGGSYSESIDCSVDYSAYGSAAFRINFYDKTGAAIDPYHGMFSVYTAAPVVTTETYAIAPDVASVAESETVTYTVTTTGVADGTTVYYSTAGNVNSADYQDGSTTGSVTITSNIGTITRTIAVDGAQEPAETFYLQLHTGSASGPVVATSSGVAINANGVSYSVTPSTSTVAEGSAVTFNVVTTGVGDGHTLYWTIAATNGSAITTADFVGASLSGSFTITSNAGSIVLTTTNTDSFEANETFTGSIRTTSISGTVVATSSEVTITNRDEYYPYVSMLLHGNGNNNGATITDNSSYAHTPTNTAVVTSTAQSVYGGSSLLFNGSTARLSYAHSDEFNFGANNLTIETYVRFTGYVTTPYGGFASACYASIISKDESVNGRAFNFLVYGTSSSYTDLVFQLFYNNGASLETITKPYAFALNTWYKVGVKKVGNTVTLYVNNTSIGSQTFTHNVPDTTSALVVGADILNPGGSANTDKFYFLPGHLEELRISNGIDRDLTIAQTAPFPDS